MKKTRLMRKIISAIALIMTIAIGLSACEISLKPPVTTTPTSETTLETTPADTPTTPTTPENTTPAPGPDAPIDPPAHVCVFSDWVTIKAPSNTEDGLRERKCECGKVEQEIIEASNTEYSVEYRNLKSASYPSETGYNSKDGLLNLPQPEAVGYQFVGWYTASIGGNLVDYIPKGSKEDYILYAHWDLVSYEITYKNVPNNTNVTTYDIEDKIKLETPKWSGLVFTHWSDANGNNYYPEANIAVLPEKMSGDLVLTANWKVLRNIATPAPAGAQLYNAFSGEDGFLYFFYDLGTIEHVVLDNINPDMYYKYEGLPITLNLSKTISVTEETAQSIADTVSKSVTSTSSWTGTKSFSETNSDNWNAHIGGAIEGEIGGGPLTKKILNWSAKLKVEGSYDWGKEHSKTEGWTNSISGSSGESNTSSNTVSTSIAYKEEITSEISESITISADLPSGYYAYVHAGNIRVIAVVSYEISTGYLYLNTYSRLDNMHSMMMYYADVNQLNNPSVEGLDFTIPEEEIISIVENSYYVKYDANGGTGTMNSTIHSIGGTERLADNTFTKAGSVFSGWELKTDSGTTILLDGQSVTNIGEPLQTVTLKALWTSVEPVWEETESGSFYYGNIPGTVDMNHSIFKNMKTAAYTEYETETTKRVVTVQWAGYVYWHWMYDTSAAGSPYRAIYHKKGTGPDNGYGYKYFFAFTSTKGNYASDKYYCNSQGITNYIVSDQKTSNAECGGATRWFRFDYYICTYTDYVKVN